MEIAEYISNTLRLLLSCILQLIERFQHIKKQRIKFSPEVMCRRRGPVVPMKILRYNAHEFKLLNRTALDFLRENIYLIRRVKRRVDGSASLHSTECLTVRLLPDWKLS
jgi:hypothetical protein